VCELQRFSHGFNDVVLERLPDFGGKRCTLTVKKVYFYALSFMLAIMLYMYSMGEIVWRLVSLDFENRDTRGKARHTERDLLPSMARATNVYFLPSLT